MFKLPRKAPDTVYEHRITFGEKERATIEDIQKLAKTAQYTAMGGVAVAGVGVAGFAWLAYTAANWLGVNNPFKDLKETYDEFRSTGIDKTESAALAAANIVNPNAVETIQARLNEAETRKAASLAAIDSFYDRAIAECNQLISSGNLTDAQIAYQQQRIAAFEAKRQQRKQETIDYFDSYKKRINVQSDVIKPVLPPWLRFLL